MLTFRWLENEKSKINRQKEEKKRKAASKENVMEIEEEEKNHFTSRIMAFEPFAYTCGKVWVVEKSQWNTIWMVYFLLLSWCVCHLSFAQHFQSVNSQLNHLISSKLQYTEKMLKWLRQESLEFSYSLAYVTLRTMPVQENEHLFPGKTTRKKKKVRLPNWRAQTLLICQMNDKEMIGTKREKKIIRKSIANEDVYCESASSFHKWNHSEVKVSEYIHNKFIITFDSLRCTTVSQYSSHLSRIIAIYWNFEIFIKQQTKKEKKRKETKR